VTGDEPELTIEELSARVGVTTRNIRAYQTQGLLPAPERRGRTGVYGAEHVAQLEMIRDLRLQGIGLPAIERLMAWGEGIPAGELRAFASSLLQGLIEETPAIEPAIDAVETWGDQVTPELVERSLATGFFRLEDDGTFVVLSPTLRAHGFELHALGVTFAEAIELMETLHDHLDAIAVTFADLFVEHFSIPALVDTADSEERVAALKTVSERLERVRPMATSAVNAAFRLVLQKRAEEALDATLKERQATRAD
jgi:DNA-binding transcriptional MerR regulator